MIFASQAKDTPGPETAILSYWRGCPPGTSTWPRGTTGVQTAAGSDPLFKIGLAEF